MVFFVWYNYSLRNPASRKSSEKYNEHKQAIVFLMVLVAVIRYKISIHGSSSGVYAKKFYRWFPSP